MFIVNNLLESQKYLQPDGQNQMVANLQMNGNRIVGLADAAEQTDGVNQEWANIFYGGSH